MCEYCENGKEMEIYGACIHTFIVNKKPAVPQIVENIATEDGVLTNSISINYCPMCGRRLTDEKEGG